MGRDFVMEMVAKAPEFTITPRNPDRASPDRRRHMVFGNVSSPPNYSDLDDGQGAGDRAASCRDLLKLTQYFNCIHFAGGYPVEPVDIHASVRHLDCLFDKLTLTDKVPMPIRSGPSGSRT
jgi:trimethylamine--corrinoid protein Co-methyltransferase